MKSKKEDNPKKDQHIVAKMIVKRFSNTDTYIKQYINDNSHRIINDTNDTIAKKATVRILKNDFTDNDEYCIRRSNIRDPKNIVFCQEYIYSFNYEDYILEAKKYNIEVFESKKDIMDKLENNYSLIEGKFSKALSSIEMPYVSRDNDFENIKRFLTSNELRPRKFFNEGIYKFNQNEMAFNKISYRIKYIIIMNLLEKFSQEIVENMDFYETMESSKLFHDSGFYKVKRNQNKYISYLNNNEEYKKNQAVLIIKNETSLDFILSDNMSSVYYDNYLKFNEIMSLIGLDKLNVVVKKINITVVNPKTMIVLFDGFFDNNFMNIEYIKEIENIKKFNSIFYNNTDEWFLFKELYLKKNDIIDTEFYNDIQHFPKVSNMVDWLYNAYTGEFYNYKINLFNNFEFEKFSLFIDNIDKIIRKNVSLFKKITNTKTNTIKNIKDDLLDIYISPNYLACSIKDESVILESIKFNNKYNLNVLKTYYEYFFGYKHEFNFFLKNDILVLFITNKK